MNARSFSQEKFVKTRHLLQKLLTDDLFTSVGVSDAGRDVLVVGVARQLVQQLDHLHQHHQHQHSASLATRTPSSASASASRSSASASSASFDIFHHQQILQLYQKYSNWYPFTSDGERQARRSCKVQYKGDSSIYTGLKFECTSMSTSGAFKTSLPNATVRDIVNKCHPSFSEE